MLHSILLVEPDDAVARDISASMRLLNVPVMRVASREEVVSSLDVARPSLVLTRFANSADAELGLGVKAIVQERATDTPVVLLLTRTEESLHARMLGEFPARLSLPVQFPTFAHEVQALLTGVVLSPGGTRPTSNAPSPSDPLPEMEPSRSDSASDELKFLLACALTQEVVQRVRGHPRVGKLGMTDIPQLVRELTDTVCASYDVASFLREVHRGNGKAQEK